MTPQRPYQVLLPVECLSCSNPSFNLWAGQTMAKSGLPALKCRKCGFVYDEQEGNAAYRRNHPHPDTLDVTS